MIYLSWENAEEGRWMSMLVISWYHAVNGNLRKGYIDFVPLQKLTVQVQMAVYVIISIEWY